MPGDGGLGAVGGDNSRMPSPSPSPSLKPYVWLSIAAALVTIALKALSPGCSPARSVCSPMHSNRWSIWPAPAWRWPCSRLPSEPEDAGHRFGHGKAEYFSSGFEGLLILFAAIAIAMAAGERLLNPQPLEAVGVGLTVSAVAAMINLLVGRVLLLAGRRHRSITLEADARHLLTDVWTSLGVVVGVGAVALTGWLWLDPILALLVASNIVWTAWRLLRRSANGLMDGSPATRTTGADSRASLKSYRRQGIDFHALRSREAGARSFIFATCSRPGRVDRNARAHQLVEEPRKRASSGTAARLRVRPYRTSRRPGFASGPRP
jgi:cation diffusion facilitator family transporter